MGKIFAKSKVRSGIISIHNSLLFQGFKSFLHALFFKHKWHHGPGGFNLCFTTLRTTDFNQVDKYTVYLAGIVGKVVN
jgi:hypothetical protein